jgi:Phage terminase small subunit.
MTNRKELAQKKARAYRLYMSGECQADIAAQVGISTTTISKWAVAEKWEERLHDEKTSSVELANSMMLAAKKMTEIIIKEIGSGSYNIETITKCSDNVVKIMASAERIANTINKATVIDVLTSLDMWLLQRSKTDPALTPELLATINRYHNEYIKYAKERE